jgi:hypothetical protein
VAPKSSTPQQIEFDNSQRAFIARGLASAEVARKSGTYVSAEALLKKLSERLDLAHKKPGGASS